MTARMAARYTSASTAAHSSNSKKLKLMLPKKIYLNWPKDCDFDDWELTAWSEEPINHPVREMQSREYTDISQVWQPATEEPQGYDWKILCQTNFGTVSKMTREETIIYYPNSGWKGCVDIERITRWAYIDDLLPKR